MVAFAFGLLHGFGFASGLKMIGLPAHEIALALLMFNIGVEVGQLFFVAALPSTPSAGQPRAFFGDPYIRFGEAVLGEIGPTS